MLYKAIIEPFMFLLLVIGLIISNGCAVSQFGMFLKDLMRWIIHHYDDGTEEADVAESQMQDHLGGTSTFVAISTFFFIVLLFILNIR